MQERAKWLALERHVKEKISPWDEEAVAEKDKELRRGHGVTLEAQQSVVSGGEWCGGWWNEHTESDTGL